MFSLETEAFYTVGSELILGHQRDTQSHAERARVLHGRTRPDPPVDLLEILRDEAATNNFLHPVLGRVDDQVCRSEPAE